MSKKTILELLDEIPLVGDGGCISEILEECHDTLNQEVMSVIEKRGIFKESREDFRKLFFEFVDSGIDVIQTFIKCSEHNSEHNSEHTKTACRLSSEVIKEGNLLLAGGLSQTSVFLDNRDEDRVKEIFRKQCEIFKNNNVDFMIVEYFNHVQECEWAIETVKEIIDCPVMSILSVDENGDLDGIPCEVCSVRMVQSGADIVGVNCCNYTPKQGLSFLAKMKHGLEENGILENVHLSFHPLVHIVSNNDEECEMSSGGNFRGSLCTIDEIREVVKDAYNMGVRYIGGCYGFEPSYFKVLSEELRLISA